MLSTIKKHHFYIPCSLLFCSVAFFLWAFLSSYWWQLDFLSYLDATKALFLGYNPFDLESLDIRKNIYEENWVEPPLFFPGQMFFFIPLLAFSPLIANLIFLLINTLSALFLPLLFISKKETIQWLVLSIITLLFFNMTPTKATLRHGQLSLLVSFFFIFSWKCKKTTVQAFFLAAATALKLSLLPLIGLLFLVKKREKTAFLAAPFFLILLFIPMLFGHSLPSLLSDYFPLIQNSTTENGYNSYSGAYIFDFRPFNGISTGNYIHFDFLRFPAINTLYKISLLLIAIHILFRERKTSSLTMESLLPLYLITLQIAYHRAYDLPLALLLLLFIAKKGYDARCWKTHLFTTPFLLWYIIPSSIMNSLWRASSQLLPFSLQLYYKGPMFPIDACIATLFTLSSILYYYSKKKKTDTLIV